MANLDKMEKEFNALMKKYESASTIREWGNYARSNSYDHNIAVAKKEWAKFKEQFEAAKLEATPEVAMQEVFNKLMKKYESASTIREWQNGARGNTYAESEKVRKQEIAKFKERFENAVVEVVV